MIRARQGALGRASLRASSPSLPYLLGMFRQHPSTPAHLGKKAESLRAASWLTEHFYPVNLLYIEVKKEDVGGEENRGKGGKETLLATENASAAIVSAK